MVNVVWQIWNMRCFFDCPPYEWRSGTSDGLFLPIYPPRSMRVVVCFNNNRHTRLVKEKFLCVCWILWEVWCLIIVLRYEDGDIRVMLVEWSWIWEILVLKFVIPVACTYGEPLCDEVGAWFIYWLSSLWVAVGDKRWSFPTNLSP